MTQSIEAGTSWVILFCSYLGFLIAIINGNLEELYEKFFLKKPAKDMKHEGYAPLVNDFEYFFSKRMFGKIRDCWDRPISSNPGAEIDVLLRQSPMEIGFDGLLSSKRLEPTGQIHRSLNLGSYNYLGFADKNSYCRDSVLECLDNFGTSMCSTRSDSGNSSLHIELEQAVAKFLGKESSVVFGMGFSTNSTVLPVLVGKGDLIISDSLNHSSIVTGCRTSVAKIATFKHNDVEDLEKVIKNSIIKGQPGTGRAWKKILVVVEGIYSMEGDICRLKEIVQVVKKYKCYIYVDEAHSIGALGKTGKGVSEFTGVDPKDIDIFMGTFTKSFGSVGGYIAANKEIIDYIKNTCFAFNYDTSITPPCMAQIISAFKILTGEDGTDLGRKRLDKLRENSNFFRKKLNEYGFHVIGDEDSPIVPVMIQVPGNLGAFSRMCLYERIAVVVVGFPATPLLQSRTRFCISAGHTIEQLEQAADKINRIGRVLKIQIKPSTI